MTPGDGLGYGAYMSSNEHRSFAKTDSWCSYTDIYIIDVGRRCHHSCLLAFFRVKEQAKAAEQQARTRVHTIYSAAINTYP
jgi:hypothetical protein